MKSHALVWRWDWARYMSSREPASSNPRDDHPDRQNALAELRAHFAMVLDSIHNPDGLEPNAAD